MTLMEYLGSLGIALYNVDENHQRKITLIQTSRALTPAEQERCRELVHGMGVEFKVQG